MNKDEYGLGDEIIIDTEIENRGFHEIGGDDIALHDNGIEVDVDCPQCEQSQVLSLSWADVGMLGLGQKVKGFERTRSGGAMTRIPCPQCRNRLIAAGDSLPVASRNSTSEVTFTSNDIRQWVAIGLEMKRIPVKIANALIQSRRRRQPGR
jgi:ribosomal protein S27E